MITDLKPYAEYKESELTWLGRAELFIEKRSQDHLEIAGAPGSYGSKAA